MYIVRATKQDGTGYLFESTIKDEVSKKDKSMRLKDWNTYTVSTVKEINDYEDSSVAKFKTAIEEINNTHKYLILNGRFSVDNYLKVHELNYVYVLSNEKVGKYFVESTRNVIDRLYRIFLDDRAPTSLVGVINDLSISILGPYKDSEISKKLDDTFNSLGITKENYKSKLYKTSKFEQLNRLGKYKYERSTSIIHKKVRNTDNG